MIARIRPGRRKYARQFWETVFREHLNSVALRYEEPAPAPEQLALKAAELADCALIAWRQRFEHSAVSAPVDQSIPAIGIVTPPTVNLFQQSGTEVSTRHTQACSTTKKDNPR